MSWSRTSFAGICMGFVAAAGCGGGGGGLAAPSTNRQQNVMVIDEGIDLAAADLQGRVAASYTETCVDEPTSDMGSDMGSDGGAAAELSFADLKAMYLAALAQPDDSCHLTGGISAKADPMASIARYKSRWNAMIRANQTPSEAFTQSEIADLMDPVDNQLMSFDYHGTATSSTVAHENPSVRLVLVERALASESDLMTDFPCLDQADVDQTVALLQDPQINAAFVAQPAEIDSDLATAMEKDDVGIVNESFGAASRVALETLQKQYCASPIDLSTYFALLDAATNAHNARVAGPAVLTIVAAGNDGAQIDSGADSLSCDLGDSKSLLVGAYDPGTLQQNTFSNFGACVDLYAPGQAIVVDYAGGWLLFADGTSFAAPLTARYASMATAVPIPFDPTGARSAVLMATDTATRFLPLNLFPADFVYQPQAATTDFVVPHAGAASAAVAPRRPPSEYELHRVLAPLKRLRRLLRR